MFAQMDRERLVEIKALLISYHAVLTRRVPQLEPVAQPLVPDVAASGARDRFDLF